MKNEDWLKQLEWGEEGEKIIANLLLKEGWFVQPLYQYEITKTPSIYYYDGNSYANKITAVDMNTYKNGQLIFVEVKRKHQWVKNWNYDGCIETGIDNRLLLKYLDIFDKTKFIVDIYFIQETMSPLGIYKLRIDRNTYPKFFEKIPGEYNFRRLDTMIKNGKEVPMSFFNINLLEKMDQSYEEAFEQTR